MFEARTAAMATPVQFQFGAPNSERDSFDSIESSKLLGDSLLEIQEAPTKDAHGDSIDD
jgi:hypothetical protein